jgi:hypothetical protein
LKYSQIIIYILFWTPYPDFMTLNLGFFCNAPNKTLNLRVQIIQLSYFLLLLLPGAAQIGESRLIVHHFTMSEGAASSSKGFNVMNSITLALLTTAFIVGELSHYLIGVISLEMARDIEFGDQKCYEKENVTSTAKPCRDFDNEQRYAQNIYTFRPTHKFRDAICLVACLPLNPDSSLVSGSTVARALTTRFWPVPSSSSSTASSASASGFSGTR